MKKELQAVLFDLDGVITDTAEYHYLAWKELARQIGVDFNRAFNEQLKGISRLESLEKILVYGGKEEQYSEREKEELATQKNEHYVQLIKNITSNDILPGITEFLQALRNRGIKTAIASASKNADAVLDGLKLTHYFDAIADASAVKKGKPDPEIFLLAAELVHANPIYCIGIEDSHAGIAAIKGANMFAVGIGSKEILAGADLIVADTSQLTFATTLEQYERNR
jgi:beta-phosphoglucomutase